MAVASRRRRSRGCRARDRASGLSGGDATPTSRALASRSSRLHRRRSVRRRPSTMSRRISATMSPASSFSIRTSLARSRTSQALATRACSRVALFVVSTSPVPLGLLKPPGELRRRHRDGRGPVARRGAELRWTVCRAAGARQKLRAPDAGPAGGRRTRLRRASADSC